MLRHNYSGIEHLSVSIERMMHFIQEEHKKEAHERLQIVVGYTG